MDETTAGLDAETYLFDPPDTVWDRALIQGHATWLDPKDMCMSSDRMGQGGPWGHTRETGGSS